MREIMQNRFLTTEISDIRIIFSFRIEIIWHSEFIFISNFIFLKVFSNNVNITIENILKIKHNSYF